MPCFLCCPAEAYTWSGLPAPQFFFVAENRHSAHVHSADGARRQQPGAAVAKSPRGCYELPLGDPHGPITPAEPSACAAVGAASVLFTSAAGTKNITTTAVRPCTCPRATHVGYLRFSLASAPTTLRMPEESTQVLVARIGYTSIQYIT